LLREGVRQEGKGKKKASIIPEFASHGENRGGEGRGRRGDVEKKTDEKTSSLFGRK